MHMELETGVTLIIGAGGQIGTELTEALRAKLGGDKVVASDIRELPAMGLNGPFELLDVMDKEGLYKVVQQYQVKVIYNLAAVLSAVGEKKPDFAWRLNMEGLLNVLDAAKELKVEKIFWPSSIAVFGPNTPRTNTPQSTIMDPNTVYGISKLAGERWCEYYFEKYGVDVRSIRYPGLIGYKAQPGGGTTDYAVEIYHEAITKGSYTSFLDSDSRLPMMYMPDAIRATLELMAAPPEAVRIRSSYNLGGISFTPSEIAAEIEAQQPGFEIAYAPDFRQQIADSWPDSIDDSSAQEHWGWKLEYDLKAMTTDMLYHIRKQYEEKTLNTA